LCFTDISSAAGTRSTQHAFRQPLALVAHSMHFVSRHS